MPTTTDLAGRVALVTGGAGGFGRAVAGMLAAADARVVVADVDEDGGRAVAAEVGGVFVRTDVADLEANRAMVATALDRFGGVDLAFLNAGVATGTTLDEGFDLERYRRAMGVNLDGVVFGIHAVLPALQARGGGAIVATSSLAGLTGVPTDPVYAANKHGVVGLVRSLGPVYASQGIRINAVCPGFADTAIIADVRDMLAQHEVPLLSAEAVADVVMTIFTGDGTGEAWFVQPGREGAPFGFRGIPGPRAD